MTHYIRCPRLHALFKKWHSIWSPRSPEGSPWLSSYFLLQSHDYNTNLLSAAMCDAFLSMHAAIRNQQAGTPAQHFEARLRMQSRRHASIARVWAAHTMSEYSLR